jgi:hypothetical protein
MGQFQPAPLPGSARAGTGKQRHPPTPTADRRTGAHGQDILDGPVEQRCHQVRIEPAADQRRRHYRGRDLHRDPRVRGARPARPRLPASGRAAPTEPLTNLSARSRMPPCEPGAPVSVVDVRPAGRYPAGSNVGRRAPERLLSARSSPRYGIAGGGLFEAAWERVRTCRSRASGSSAVPSGDG